MLMTILQDCSDLASQMATNAIQEIETFAKHIHEEIRHIFDNIDNYKEGTTFNLTLTLTAPDTAEFDEELEKVKGYYL